ncbi:LuxR C-terminal-related transcriptional regulator [Oscillospiraceae bacterium LTW-04]|nr:LuxR C-terminal-related transcriptional regulator [Oscillospiraceae bacterium MB24-C1]
MARVQIQFDKPYVYIPTTLQNRLETIHSYPLTILQAASGFGKTTAISKYLFQAEAHQVYWYTCMGEPIRKAWNGICKMFSHIDKNVARQLEALAYPTQDNLVDIAEILGGCSVDGETWVIIDNFQYIQNSLPERMLHALARHSSQWLHIVVITQSIDNMDIGGISSDKIYVIENSAFFFQKIDTNAYFQANGITLSCDELDRLHMLSEGWVAALNLQLIHYRQERDFEATDSMDDLIQSVIWNRLELEEQLFLIAVSSLDRFTTEQAYIILQKDVFSGSIARLLNSGSFIRYERVSGAYTLHSLLKKFLRQEMTKLPAEEISRIQKLAADAYAAVGDRYHALRNYLEVAEFQTLLSLPLKASDFALYLEDGSAKVLEEVLNKCDRALLMQYPQTLSMITFELFRAGSYTAFGRGCALIADILSQPEQCGLSANETRTLSGQMALLQSFMAFNDIEKMSVLHRKAWELLGGSFSNRSDWNDSWTFGQTSVLYMFWSKSGALDNELACMEECLPYYIRLTQGHGTGADCAMQAEALLMRGNDTAAEALCYKAIYLADEQEQDSICFAAETVLLRIALLRGDTETYENVRQSILKRAKTCVEPMGRRMADLALSFVSVLVDDGAVSEWLTDLDKIATVLYEVAVPFGVLVYLRWLVPQNQNAKLLGIAQGALPAVVQHHFLLPQVYFHLFSAIAHSRQRQMQEAQAALDRALAIALPDGIYLPFVEYGEQLEPLLAARSQSPDMTGVLSLYKRHKTGVEKLKKSVAIGRLSPREREVARLAADGLTNRAIAARLLISQETVKAVMKNIFQKLSIGSRVQLKTLKHAGKI